MSGNFLPNVSESAFGVVSRFVFAGLLVVVCAGCAVQKWVPEQDLEAERQRRQVFQARQEHLLKELKKQIAVQGELEKMLAAEGRKLQKFEAENQVLKEKLHAESVVQAQLLAEIAEQKRQHNALVQELKQELEQQSASREALHADVENLEKRLAEESLKRQEWEQWQEQLERDLLRRSASNQIRNDDRPAYQQEQFPGDDVSRDDWALRADEQDLEALSTARENLDYGDANLYLLLLEKKAYIARLAEQIEKVVSEVVRAKAKLRNLESKAEAASNLAESEIAVESLKARGIAWKSDPSVVKAERLNTLSAREFEDGNYGGALYLTGQAKSLIESARARSNDQEKSAMVEGEVPFLLPLTLQLLNKSNVRTGPGSDFGILFSWESSTAIVGHAFKGQWVRVTNEDGLGGWVFYKSVGSN